MGTSLARPVLEFDHHALEASLDREALLARTAGHPIFFTEANGGHWVVASHALAKQVLRDPATFSSLKQDDGSGGVTIPTVMGPRLLPAEADGAYHRALRKILTPKFNRMTVDEMAPTVDSFIVETIDRVIQKGDFDVVHDIADVIPAGVMVRYLGFPDETRLPFIESIQAAMSALPKAGSGEMTPELEAGMAAFMRAVEVINDLVSERKARPTDDVVSYLVAPEHALSDDELLWLIFTLILGGAENPAALISNTLLRLSEYDVLRAQLAADLTLIPGAVDEFLRIVTAGVSTARNVAADVELGGCQLQAGERVLVWLPGANHDASVFEDPATFSLDRGRCPHIGFGDGPHICVGDKLARLEMEVLLREVLTRMPNFKVDVEASARFEDAATMYGWKVMPARTAR